MRYDIIGDTHGRAPQLRALFEQMGYTRKGMGYRPPEGFMPVFIGDFIDRGPAQQETVSIARSMVDEADAMAIMGNHEFNAICFATPGREGGFVRPHSEKNIHQHKRFLSEFPPGSDSYKSAIGWFKTLPLHLNFNFPGGFRMIHACWHDASLRDAAPVIQADRRLTDAAYTAYEDDRNGAISVALENLLKGPEYKLPPGVSFVDPHGIERYESRFFWWSGGKPHERLKLGGVTLTDAQKELIDNDPLASTFNASALDKPVVVGHFNLDRSPGLLEDSTGNVLCVDFDKHVVAYRWDTENPAFSADRLEFVRY